MTVLHSIALTVLLFTGNQDLMEITDYVDLDIEKNIPSFYSAFAIFLCSLLFFCISSLEKKQVRRRCYWLGLAAVFLFLSLDEAFVLHEGLGDYTEEYIKTTGILQASGLLYFPWIIPYGILTTLLGMLYFRFILHLPRKTTVLLIISAIIFLTGAAFFDMLGGREAELHGYYSVTYTVLYTIEEFLEMSGIVLLMYTLLDYIEQQFGHLCLSLRIQEP
ncbi:MAG: peptidase M48 Ste24p [Candidatus Electrothrix sp. GM3_4]|nr:peptidase M48 Ste24p [Candidatus Electrothrix sp. GM3_4]